CLLIVLLVFSVAGAARDVAPVEQDLDGDASAGLTGHPPTSAVRAAFTESSYAPAATALLHLRGSAQVLRIRLYHAAAGHDGPLQGAPVTPSRTFRASASKVALTVGAWPSGLY